MAYKNISLEVLEEKYGVRSEIKKIVSDVTLTEPIPCIQTTLEEYKEYSLWTEKARSEFIVAPILAEIRRRNNKYISIYSGVNFKVDKDMIGESDFIITKNIKNSRLNFPIMQIVEAKKQDIDLEIPQCAV